MRRHGHVSTIRSRTAGSAAPRHRSTRNVSENCVIVFLHGFAFGCRSWRPQLNVDLGLRVLAYDAIGHGGNRIRSYLSPDLHSESLIEELDSYVASSRAKKVILVGLSMGGNTAMRYTLRYPEKVAGLVLLSTGSDEVEGGRFRSRAARYADILEQQGIQGFTAELLGQARFSGFTLTQRLFAESCISESDPLCLSQVARKILAVRRPSLALLADRPTETQALVICGANDPACVAALPALERVLPCSRSVTVPLAGHLCNIEAADQINQLIMGFVRDLKLEA
ncbi:MAG: alpha/beta fold hydrolase [Sciscionella sp.]